MQVKFNFNTTWNQIKLLYNYFVFFVIPHNFNSPTGLPLVCGHKIHLYKNMSEHKQIFEWKNNLPTNILTIIFCFCYYCKIFRMSLIESIAKKINYYVLCAQKCYWPPLFHIIFYKCLHNPTKSNHKVTLQSIWIESILFHI